MRLAVCMDSKNEMESIRLFLEQIGREFCFPVEAEWFESCTALMEWYRPGSYALVLLDGDMPDCVKAGGNLRNMDRGCRCILLTRDNSSALLGYSIHPDGFVRKPAGYRALRGALLRCSQAWWGELRTLLVTANRVRIPVTLADIYYIEISGRVLVIHGRYGRIETEMSMTQAEGKLQGAPFLKCHRSYLVNLFHVRAFEADALVMEDGGIVPVSEDRREKVQERWRQFREENPAFFREAWGDSGNW